MKKLVILVLMCALLTPYAALAAGALDATEAAKAYAPANAVYLYTEKDGDAYEVYFMNLETGEEFEIDIDILSGAVVRLDSKVENARGSSVIALTDEAAFQAVLAEYPDAALAGVTRELEDGLYEARVYFTAPGLYGVMCLNAETGALIEREILYGTPETGWERAFDGGDTVAPGADARPESTPKPGKDTKQDKENDFIGVASAKNVITGKYPGAKITEIELDRENGKYVYEGEAIYKNAEYDFEIDAATGKLLRWTRDD